MRTKKFLTNKICHHLAIELARVVPAETFVNLLSDSGIYNNMYKISNYLASTHRKRISGELALLGYDQLIAYYALKHFIRKKYMSDERFHIYFKKRSHLPWFEIYIEHCAGRTKCKIEVTINRVLCLYYTQFSHHKLYIV